MRHQGVMGLAQVRRQVGPVLSLTHGFLSVRLAPRRLAGLPRRRRRLHRFPILIDAISLPD
jgi:hypothetical protein